MIYELIQPSDPVTFKADRDEVAFAIALYLGNGKAGCRREDDKSIPSLLIFADEGTIKSTVQEQLGTSTVNEFFNANLIECADAFDSFSYGSFGARRQFDDAVEAITDPEKLAEFKRKHEDRCRTSINKWVDYAWRCGKALRKAHEEGKTV